MPTGTVRLRHLWPAAALIACCGCGVAEYETRMLEAQKRVQRWDEETQLLGNAVQVPTRETKEGTYPLASLFFRPPKGIRINPSPTGPRDRHGLIYTYDSTSQGAAGPFHRVDLAFADQSLKEFSSQVLEEYQVKEVAGSRKTGSRKAWWWNPSAAESPEFRFVDFNDGSTFYSVNFWRGKHNQIAVTYLVRNDQVGRARRALEVSLGSFAAESQASEAQSRGDPLRTFAQPKR